MPKMLLGVLSTKFRPGTGGGGAVTPDEPPPATPTVVANWRFNEAAGVSTLADSVGSANGTWPGGAPSEAQLSPLTAGASTSIGVDGTDYAVVTATADLKKSSYGRGGYFQPDVVTAAKQQVIFAQDEILNDTKPPGGCTVELFGNVIGAYTRDATGADKWLTSNGAVADARPGSGPAGAQIAANQAFAWLLEVDPTDLVKTTRLWVWKAGDAQPTDPVLYSTNSTGLSAYSGTLAFGAYYGGAAACDGVLDQFWAWNGAPGAAAFGAAGSGKPLTPPTSITRGAPPTTTGVQLPTFGYQTITDAVPSGGAIWWDPRKANDNGDGLSKANAKRTFGAAESLAFTTGKRIILAGTAGETVYHDLSSVITPTKSGASSSDRMELYAEPNCTVVLVRDGDMVGGLTGSWTWTQITSGGFTAAMKVYQASPTFPDGASTITALGSSGPDADGSWWLQGMIEIPDGPLGRPYFMVLPWIDEARAKNTGGGFPSDSTNAGYTGPCIWFSTGGKLRVRLQPPNVAASGNEWPTDGIMGSLINSSGAWQKPNLTPDNYRIHVVRLTDPDGRRNIGAWGFGNSARNIFDFTANGVDNWTIKGINADLCNAWANVGNGNTNLRFERCTRFTLFTDTFCEGQTNNIVNDHCQIFLPFKHSISWREHKNGGLWTQLMRGAFVTGRGAFSSDSNWTFSDCVITGSFDFFYGPQNPAKYRFLIDHCAVLYTYDDGFVQDAANKWPRIEYAYSLIWGGPVFSGGGGSVNQAGSEHWYMHHCVYDHRLPMLWAPYQSAYADNNNAGISPNQMFPHSGATDGGHPMKVYYNTFVTCGFGGKNVGNVFTPGPSVSGIEIGDAWQHEIYNNIYLVTGSRPYTTPGTAGSTKGDYIVYRICCKQSVAGTKRHDYNVYFRSIPWTRFCANEFLEIQDSRGVNLINYANFGAFQSAMASRSTSMYAAGTGGFGANKPGVVGPHEAHGLGVNPALTNIAKLDYRPTNASVKTGALNLTTSGWPGTNTYQAWRGACNPAGTGNDVGPGP